MKTEILFEVLQQIQIFSSLQRDEMKTLESYSTLSTYQKGEYLFLQGDRSQHLMILIDGVVSIYKHDSKGNEVVIGYFNRYALLAEAATLRKTPLPSSARFHTDGQVLKIALEGFESLMLRHPQLSYEIIHSLLDKIDLLQQNIHFNLAASAKEKVLNFYEKNPKLVRDLKQYEIASILGMTPETLSRNTTRLSKEGLLLQTATGYKAKESTS